MSGIVGIFHRDGRPVNRELLQKLVNAIRFRGPDAQATWIEGNIGFGHTMLRTTWEAEYEHQPLTLDGRVSLVADARIDYREELIAKLAEQPETPHDRTPDAELILRAYQQWGEQCVEHLRGDFAFAIWDARERKLFCARDHFGVKPFYYAELGETFLFSNDLRCLRRYPGISQDLNEQAMVDFLVFGHNREPGTTSFASVQKLPAGHCMEVQKERSRTSRYWTLQEGRVCNLRHGEYEAGFGHLLFEATRTRLRADKICTFMSGGLDSTAMTAVAMDAVRQSTRPLQLEAFNQIEDLVAPDPEKQYSQIAAQFLGLPVHHLITNDYRLCERLDSREVSYAEPKDYAMLAIDRDLLARASTFGRVALRGAGGDVALLATHASQDLSMALAWGMFTSVSRLFIAHRRVPRIGLRTVFRRARKESPPATSPPRWLRPEVAERFDIPRRWHQIGVPDDPSGPRAEALGATQDIAWSTYFEMDHAGPGDNHLEIRYPFFDVKLLEFLFSVPPLPWFVEKHILRQAMKGKLPDAVRLRPKSWIQHGVIEGRPEEFRALIQSFSPRAELAAWMDWEVAREELRSESELAHWIGMRIPELHFWLSTSDSCWPDGQ